MPPPFMYFLTSDEFNACYFMYLAHADVSGIEDGEGMLPWPVPLTQHLYVGASMLSQLGHQFTHLILTHYPDGKRHSLQPGSAEPPSEGVQHGREVFYQFVAGEFDVIGRARECREWLNDSARDYLGLRSLLGRFIDTAH